MVAGTKQTVESLLVPASIAVVGASERVFYSRDLIANLIRYGYKGPVYPVNPKHSKILDLRCYPTISDIAGPVDLVIFVIGRQAVVDSLDECERKGVKSLLVLTTGFAEADEEGKRLQKRLTEFARRSGIRICGPNLLGFLNLQECVIASPFPSDGDEKADLIPGGVALISQSGGLGIGSAFEYGREKGVSFSHVVTTGNEADLEISDFIEYFANLPDVRAIGLLIEGLKDSSKFIHACERAIRAGKVMVVLKLGTTAKGAQSALSHTGSLVGSQPVYSAFFRQAGVIEATDIEELVEFVSLVDKCKLPKGPGVALISTSGGLATMLADLSEEVNLTLPEIAGTSLEEKLLSTRVLLSFGSLKNPLDVRAAGITNLTTIMRPFFEDERFHLIVAACEVCGVDQPSQRLTQDLIELTAESPKPIIALWTGPRSPAGTQRISNLPYEILEKSKVPLFRNPRRCLKGAKALINLSGRRQRSLRFLERIAKISSQPKADDSKWLEISGRFSDTQCMDLLAHYGISVVTGRVCESLEEAKILAKEMSYPVVLKASGKEIAHLTDARAVRLNIKSEEELASSYREVLQNARSYFGTDKVEGALVQKMVQGAQEVLIGVSRDALFGPFITLGLGGTLVEVKRDFTVRVPPIDAEDAEEMIHELKGYSLLAGFRGSPPTDTDSLVDILGQVSRLVLDFRDRIVEADINPVMVLPKGQGAFAADFLIRFN